ncbi:FixH family protein [Glaciecola sp. XM2]|uniref:FixH family protein n=1 Tax=Glaciecola sp. XM2 TaxID=1914931 RepID=UPI001BDF6C06|nr:FixH family protein [Glaciecola sp. XM2]MBT1449639.1 FixH family protein [Glaciecola sp. XM2]
MQEQDTQPWYKQFWPWFLIAIPLSSVIVGSFVLRFATDGTNTLVVDDYYKEGKAINARLDKIERARELGITTLLDVQPGNIALEFVTSAPDSGEALKLDFFHVTLADKDFDVLLTRDANGVYRTSIDYPIQGKWRLRLMPMDESWKVQDTVNLPQARAFKFNP